MWSINKYIKTIGLLKDAQMNSISEILFVHLTFAISNRISVSGFLGLCTEQFLDIITRALLYTIQVLLSPYMYTQYCTYMSIVQNIIIRINLVCYCA